MSILTIPRELQFNILGLLSIPDRLRLSETCHGLKDVVRDPSLWKKLVLCYKMINENTKACRDHVARCSKLEEMVINFARFPPLERIRCEKIMNVVMKAKKTLKSLPIDNLRLSNSSIKDIGQLNQLTRLEINAVNIRSYAIAALAKLSELKSLKMVNLPREGGWIMMDEDYYLNDLVDLFSKLKKLEVVNLEGYGEMNDEVIESLVVNNPNLHHLNIRNTKNGFIQNLTRKSLESIADNCPQITHIDIGFLVKFRNDHVSTFISKCSKLKYANFENTLIEDSALAMLASNCPDLEDLKISECVQITLQGIKEFLDKASNAKLKSLDVTDCGALSWGDQWLDRLRSMEQLEQIFPHIEIHK